MDATAIAKLVGELLIVISSLSTYAVPAAAPAVEFVAPAELQRQVCDKPCDVRGWFPPGQVVYLDARLDPLSDVGARGILLHELVHYVQQEAGAFPDEHGCEAWTAREREAFDIQIRWLAQQSAPLNAFSRFGRMPFQVACTDTGGDLPG